MLFVDFGILTQGLAALDIIHDVGYMGGAMICSAEQLVLGDENIGMAKRFMQGIKVSKETQGVDTISKVGPGGNFLVEDHTLKFLRQEIWAPKLMMQKSHDIWKNEGSKDTTQRIQEKIQNIMEEHEVPPHPDKTLSALEKIRQKGEKNEHR
jgi:trimethylamine--corrinoid protein Co-methyltransferase